MTITVLSPLMTRLAADLALSNTETRIVHREETLFFWRGDSDDSIPFEEFFRKERDLRVLNHTRGNRLHHCLGRREDLFLLLAGEATRLLRNLGWRSRRCPYGGNGTGNRSRCRQCPWN